VPDSPAPSNDTADTATSQPAESWRAPVTVQARSVVSAALGILVAAVFFPLWIAVPVAVLLGAWGLGMAARRPVVTLDPGSGLLTVTLGFLTRRVRLGDISAVQLDRAKVTFGKADGTAVSVHAWRRGRVDAWLRVPDIASDMAHAVSRAASAARPQEQEQEQEGKTGASARIRSGKNVPLIVVAVAGLVEIAAVFFVRVSWASPVMTALGALVALGFGFTGIFSVVFALWTYLTGRPAAARARG
jgi:hypothetical protein